MVAPEALVVETIDNPYMSQSQTSLTLTSKLARRLSTRSWWVPLALALALGGVAWFVHRTIVSTAMASLADKLETIRNANVAALEQWIDAQQLVVSVTNQDPRLVGLVTAHRQAMTAKNEDAASTGAALNDYLEHTCEAHNYLGFALVDHAGRVLATRRDPEEGDKLAVLPLDKLPCLARAINDETTICRPFRAWLPLLDADGVLRENLPTLLVAGPIRDASGEVVAALAYRIDPARDFTRILSVGRPGASGETYAFDQDGLLLSDSRFEEELRSIGLIEPEADSILNIMVRDPGGDMTKGFTPTVAARARPLTRMAAAAVDGLDGHDVDGYRDYRGVEVVGAWTWLDQYGFGVATELDTEEAFSALIVLQSVFWGLFSLLVIASGVMLGASVVLDKMRRKVKEATQLGQYTLHEKLGQGGMGAVYRASHALLRRPTAVKLLLPESTSETAIARFQREVQLTAQLTNPNTIAIYDYGRTPDGVFYYAMEYLKGLALDDLIKKDGVQPSERVAHILAQVCGSLAEAHSIGLIHRDIKPANIMLTRRGGIDDFIKVLDFGLVKNIGEEEDVALTVVGNVTGTPLFMAPEAIKSEKVDARADLYAVAGVGYCLLTGTPPFRGSNVGQLLGHHLHSAVEPAATRLGRAVDPGLDALLQRAMEKDPAKRPDDARQFLKELRRCDCFGAWTPEQAATWWDSKGQSYVPSMDAVGPREPATRPALMVDVHDRVDDQTRAL